MPAGTIRPSYRLDLTGRLWTGLIEWISRD